MHSFGCRESRQKSLKKRETSRKGLFEESFFVMLAKIIFLSSL